MPNLVSLFHPSPQILDKVQVGEFPISRILVKFLINKNYHNCKTSNDIDMKLGPVTKLDKRNMTTPNNLTMNLCRQNLRLSSFFQLMTHLEERINYNFYISFITQKMKGELKTLTELSCYHFC